MPPYLWEGTEQQANITRDRMSAPDLPVFFDESYEKSKAAEEYFGASNFTRNTRNAVIQDYLDSVYRRTGKRITPVLEQKGAYELTPEEMVDQLKPHIDTLRKDYPDLPMLSAEELDIRATQKSQHARHEYNELRKREQTWGATFGGMFGGAVGGFKDPLNIGALYLGLNPSASMGIVGNAMVTGGGQAASQALNEALGAEAREDIEPGYLASREPYYNVLQQFGTGAVLGAGGYALGKGTAWAWQRFRAGYWPETIKTAGNKITSEAQIESTNILAGAEGEVTHRENLGKAMQQVLDGEPVRVHLDPEIRRRSENMLADLEKQTGIHLPVIDEGKIQLLGEAADLSEKHYDLQVHLNSIPDTPVEAGEKLARLNQVEGRMAEIAFDKRQPLKFLEATAEREQLKARREELLQGTSREELEQQARRIEDRRTTEAQMESIQRRLDEIDSKVQSGLPQTFTLGQSIREADFHYMPGAREVIPGRGQAARHWMTDAMSAEKKMALAHGMHPEEVKKTLASEDLKKVYQHDVNMAVHGHPEVKVGDKFRDAKGEYKITHIAADGKSFIGERPDGTPVDITGHPHGQVEIGGKKLLTPEETQGLDLDKQINVGRNDDPTKTTPRQVLNEIEKLQNAADVLEGCLLPAAGVAAGGAAIVGS